MDDLKRALGTAAGDDLRYCIPAILEILKGEGILNVGIMGMALKRDDTFEQFCSKHSLTKEQAKVTKEAIRLCQKANTHFVNAACKRAALVTQLWPDSGPVLSSSSNFVGNVTSADHPAKIPRLESSLMKIMLGKQTTNSSSMEIKTSKDVSLRSLAEKRRVVVVNQCKRLLARIGEISLRFQSIVKSKGSLEEMMNETYFATANVDTVGGYCRCVHVFLDWIVPIVTLKSLTEFEAGAFLRDCRERGVHVASRHRYALIWAAKVYKICLFAEDEVCMAMCARRSAAGPRDMPVKARCPTVDMVCLLEEACCNVKNPVVIRVIAGLLCALTHGVLRWSDFQRSVGMVLGRDLLVAKATMKRKDMLTPWVAARKGFSGTDWAKDFVNLLCIHNMPGEDFILRTPVNPHNFVEDPCSYASCILWMRTSLIYLGFSARDSLSFTLHGWRQLYLQCQIN